MSVLVKPIVTEKFASLTEDQNKFTFEVERDANKVEIKKAVEDMYGVSVASVNTAIGPRKKKSRFTKAGAIVGKTKSVKRAIITLAEGDNIDFYSNI